MCKGLLGQPSVIQRLSVSVRVRYYLYFTTSVNGWVAACGSNWTYRNPHYPCLASTVTVWSGRLKENQAASALPTTHLFYQIRFQPDAPPAAPPQSPRAHRLGPTAVKTLSNLIWRDGERGSVGAATFHSISTIFTPFFSELSRSFLHRFFGVPVPRL